MATEPPGLDRRAWLRAGCAAALGAGCTAALGDAGLAQAADAAAATVAAAWSADDGGNFIGLLSLKTGAAPAYRTASVLRRRCRVPTRAHGLIVLADGSVVAAARRPGEWLLRWWPHRRGASAVRWHWLGPERRLNGHLLLATDGRHVLCSETALEDGSGWVVRRDPHTLDVVDAWPSHGTDPHELLWDADGSLLVANGGVHMQPEHGRAKRHSPIGLDASLVRLNPTSGHLIGRWSLADRWLSPRHLARQRSGAVLVGLQAEHAEPAARENAPLWAVFDGHSLRAPAHAAWAVGLPLHGYAGAVAAWGDGFAISAPRAGRVVVCDAGGIPRQLLDVPEACALAPGTPQGLAGGSRTLSGARLDNHWVVYGKGASASGFSATTPPTRRATAPRPA